MLSYITALLYITVYTKHFMFLDSGTYFYKTCRLRLFTSREYTNDPVYFSFVNISCLVIFLKYSFKDLND